MLKSDAGKKDTDMSEYKRFVIDETVYETFLVPSIEFRPVPPARDQYRIHAALPGVIERIQVARGQKVKRGDRLLVLDAMRTRSDVLAPSDGVVRELAVSRGQKVAQGQTLLELE